MNTFSSGICSSGCESGWTLYLENSFLDQNAAASHRRGTEGFYEEEHKDKRFKGEEEDLSMVSDASSGPPHFPDYDEAYFNEEVNGCFYSASNKAVKLAKSGAKKQKVKENQQHLQDQQHLPSFLHDTATSSPVFDFSTNNANVDNQQTSIGSMLDYSQGFSTTYFEGRPSFQGEHFGFLQSGNELQGNKWYGGKGMGIR